MGKIIVIEGLDGCGKSTQLEKLQHSVLNARTVSFPNYDSPTGQLIKEYLAGNVKANRYAATSMYSVDRYNSYIQDWQRDYLVGKTILCGRYTTSNLIYQGACLLPNQKAFTEFINWVESFEYSLLGLPQPEKVIYLDMPVEKSQELLLERYHGDSSKKDIHERDIDFMKACEKAAHYLAELKNWTIIPCLKNGELRTVEDIHKDILSTIK